MQQDGEGKRPSGNLKAKTPPPFPVDDPAAEAQDASDPYASEDDPAPETQAAEENDPSPEASPTDPKKASSQGGHGLGGNARSRVIRAKDSKEKPPPQTPPTDPEEDRGTRVLGPGTSQELVIVSYSDSPLLSGRADAEGDDGPQESEENLIIVRDMVAQYAEEVEEQTRKAQEEEEEDAADSSAETDVVPPPPPLPPREETGDASSDATLPPAPPPPLPPREETRDASSDATSDESSDATPDVALTPSRLEINWDEQLRQGWDTKAKSKATRVVHPADDPGLAGDPSRKRPARPAPVGPRVVVAAGAVIFAGATVLMALRIEPFATWYYLFAWYPFLLAVNHVTAARSPGHSILGQRALDIAALAAWSIPVWLTFEAWNFRVENWYYVGVPDDPTAQRFGILLSFATVLPGLFLLEEAQAVRGAFAQLKTKKFRIGAGVEMALLGVGGVWLTATLALPQYFFALMWGAPVLMIESWLYRRDPESLLADLAAGRPGRILRLLVAGLACGLFWEAANFFAVGKWIYTVPGFEDGKLFEMPFLGFLGFAPFALCCWSMSRALVSLGVLPDWIRDTRNLRQRRSTTVKLAAAAIAVIFSGLVLTGMDEWTVDSRTPRPEDVPAIPDGVTEYARRHGVSNVRGLLALIEEGRLHIPGESSEVELDLLHGRCELILLSGIGTRNAARLDQVGVTSIAILAGRDPAELVNQLADVDPDWRPRPRRVYVWVQAARRALDSSG